MSGIDARGRAGGAALRGQAEQLSRRAPSSLVLARRLKRRRLTRAVVAAVVVGLVAVVGLNLVTGGGSVLIEPIDELPVRPVPETPDAQAAVPEVCSRRASAIVVADLFAAVAAEQSSLSDRFFATGDRFRFFSDPDHQAGQISLDDLDAHLATLHEQVAGHELLAVDRHVVNDAGGTQTASVQFWIEPPTDVGPGAGHAEIDCDTGRLIQLAVTAWSTDVDAGHPPATCSAAAVETRLAQLVDAVEADQAQTIETRFSPADIFDVYLDRATPSSGIRDPRSLAPHLTTMGRSPIDIDARELRYYAHVYWASADRERPVGVARFTSKVPGKGGGYVTAALDCETGTILYLSVANDHLAPPPTDDDTPV